MFRLYSHQRRIFDILFICNGFRFEVVSPVVSSQLESAESALLRLCAKCATRQSTFKTKTNDPQQVCRSVVAIDVTIIVHKSRFTCNTSLSRCITINQCAERRMEKWKQERNQSLLYGYWWSVCFNISSILIYWYNDFCLWHSV